MKLLIIILAIILIVSALLVFVPLPFKIRVVNGKFMFKIYNSPYFNRKKKDKNMDKSSECESKSEFDFKKIPLTFEDAASRISAAKELYRDTKGEIKKVFTSFIKVSDIKYYRAVVTFGLDDPMATGMAVGLAGGLAAELDYFFKALTGLSDNSLSYISAQPNFNEPSFNYVAELKLNVSLLKFIIFIKELLKYKQTNQDKFNQILGGSKNE